MTKNLISYMPIRLMHRAKSDFCIERVKELKRGNGR